MADRQNTSGLAIRTLTKAPESQPQIKGGLIPHSGQGSRYTPKAFVEFCESVHVSQSMGKAGCPCDSAPMERYFNTMKNECANLCGFQTGEALYQTAENLPVSHTTMFVRTVIMDTEHFIRRGLLHNLETNFISHTRYKNA